MRYEFVSREEHPTQFVDKYIVTDHDGRNPQPFERVVPKRDGKTQKKRRMGK